MNQRLLLPAFWLAGSIGAATAAPPDEWRGLLYTCGKHPTVHIPADVAYAYEKDLTRYTEGTVTFKGSSATVSFPGKYGSFTITKRGARYTSDGKRCTIDRV